MEVFVVTHKNDLESQWVRIRVYWVSVVLRRASQYYMTADLWLCWARMAQCLWLPRHLHRTLLRPVMCNLQHRLKWFTRILLTTKP